MDEQRQDNQLEPTYSSSVLIWDVALKICWKQWTIGRGGERGSGISELMVQHDDDDDDSISAEVRISSSIINAIFKHLIVYFESPGSTLIDNDREFNN